MLTYEEVRMTHRLKRFEYNNEEHSNSSNTRSDDKFICRPIHLKIYFRFFNTKVRIDLVQNQEVNIQGIYSAHPQLTGYDTKSISKHNIASLNTNFSFSQTGCLKSYRNQSSLLFTHCKGEYIYIHVFAKCISTR